MEHAPSAARRMWRLFEPIHAVVYFSPEPIEALRTAGYRGFWMGYFAGRAAPLGPVGPDLVHALFHNFTFGRVARALPDAWALAPPEAALEARSTGAVAALRRHLGRPGQGVVPEATLARAADLAEAAVRAAPAEGRPLFAANRAVPTSADPLARLWQAVTALREHRGDGHVAALVAAGVGGREAHVLHALASGSPRETYETSRGFDEQEWAQTTAGLRSRGLVDGHEPGADALTPAGRALKDEVERRTDELACAAFGAMTRAELDALAASLAPVTAAVLAAGEIPTRSPIGLDLGDSAAAAAAARA